MKHRFPKKYRVEELDRHIRKSHTKAEVQALKKCAKKQISAPRLIEEDLKEGKILMSKVEGKTLKSYLDESKLTCEMYF